MNKKASAEELATLALAKSIVEGDAEAAMGALKAKADYDAFWIDGATRLRDLAKSRGARSVSQMIEEAAGSRGLKGLPPMAESPNRWSQALAVYVALRGYEFSGMTRLLSGDPGTKLRGLDTAKAAAKLIGSKWGRVENAKCENAKRGGLSHWTLSFGPIWQGARRVTGFVIQFSVDARVRQLVEKFHEAQGAGAATDPPSLCDPLVSKQKDWEASFVAERHVGCGHGVDGAISCLREGGNPFDKTYRSKSGEFTWDDEGAEMKSFMALVRHEVGPGPGWHVRLAPFLTDAGIDALKTKFGLETSLAEMGPPAVRALGRHLTDC